MYDIKSEIQINFSSRPLPKSGDPSSLIDCSAIPTGIDKRLLKAESYFPYISPK